MIRLAYWLIVSLLVTAGIAWLIGLPGILTIEMLGFRVQPRLGVAAFLVIAAIAVVILVWGIVKRIVAAPYYIARRSRERRKDLGFLALSDGFIALQAGDANRARQLAREAQGNLPRNAAAQLLEARADLALGDMHSAREHYRALISNRKTALAALSGLYDQARQQGRTDAALTFAQKALDIAPQAPWAREAVFDDLTRNGRWDEALRMVADETAVSREEKMRKRRRQAVVETARAQLAEGRDPAAALEHSLAALKLQPDFVPAALVAARIYANRNEARRASSLLRRVWRATSHPDVAVLFANATPGTSAVDRLKRISELVESPPPNKASALVLARAAIDAFDWTLARSALSNYAGANSSQAVCLLMAEIEEGETGDKGKARDWLNRAVRAPRDPVWTADGITSDEWEPLSPVSGKLDAFEWRVPTSAVAARTSATGSAVATTEPTTPRAAPLALPEG
ncbi:heme biosynthesis protein HemY [Devosia sp.]|uniref:heme biosynthesis protein HemY n=1 Tax=Devosia sp. TaxID=1871048 RepID=UPI003BAA3AEC